MNQKLDLVAEREPFFGEGNPAAIGAIYAPVKLALRLLSADASRGAPLGPEALAQAYAALSSASDWLKASTDIVNLAKERVRESLPSNVVILDTCKGRPTPRANEPR